MNRNKHVTPSKKFLTRASVLSQESNQTCCFLSHLFMLKEKSSSTQIPITVFPSFKMTADNHCASAVSHPLPLISNCSRVFRFFSEWRKTHLKCNDYFYLHYNEIQPWNISSSQCTVLALSIHFGSFQQFEEIVGLIWIRPKMRIWNSGWFCLWVLQFCERMFCSEYYTLYLLYYQITCLLHESLAQTFLWQNPRYNF